MHDRKLLLIPKIEDGIVIDHIPAGLGTPLLELLRKFSELKDSIFSVGLNYNSDKLGRKDMVKIGVRELPERALQEISIIAPGVSIKGITDYEVNKRYTLHMPDDIVGLVRCKNPNCITNFERKLETRFTCVKRELALYRCGHCERVFELDKLERTLA